MHQINMAVKPNPNKQAIFKHLLKVNELRIV